MTFERARKWSGIAILVLIIGAAIWGFGLGSFCYFHLGIIRLMCPVGFVELCLSNRTIYWNLVPPFLLVIGLIILLGRMFCSWICPVGFLIEWSDQLLSKILPTKVYRWRKKCRIILLNKLPKLGYKDSIAILAGAFAGIAIFRFPFISTFCPIGVVIRNTINLFTHFQVKSDLLLLLIVVFAGYLFLDGWRSCCPVGALRSIGATANRFLIPTVDLDKCNHCGVCERVCPVHFSLPDGKYDARICAKCFSCIDRCPQKAISLAFFSIGNFKKPK